MEILSPGSGLILWQLVGLLMLAVYALAIIHVVRRTFRNETHRLIWLAVVILAPFLGATVYFFAGSRDKPV